MFHTLGLAPSPKDVDLYEEARKHPLVYHAHEDPGVIEETRIHNKEAEADKAGNTDPIEDSSDESDGEWEASDHENEGVSPGDAPMADGERTKGRKPLSVPEKVSHMSQSRGPAPN